MSASPPCPLKLGIIFRSLFISTKEVLQLGHCICQVVCLWIYFEGLRKKIKLLNQFPQYVRNVGLGSIPLNFRVAPDQGADPGNLFQFCYPWAMICALREHLKVRIWIEYLILLYKASCAAPESRTLKTSENQSLILQYKCRAADLFVLWKQKHLCNTSGSPTHCLCACESGSRSVTVTF